MTCTDFRTVTDRRLTRAEQAAMIRHHDQCVGCQAYCESLPPLTDAEADRVTAELLANVDDAEFREVLTVT